MRQQRWGYIWFTYAALGVLAVVVIVDILQG
jgi:hypothetical protein